MTTETQYTGLAADSIETIIATWNAWNAEFPNPDPSDPCPAEFLEDVHHTAIDCLDIDTLHPEKVVRFDAETAKNITELREEHRAAFADYGKDTEWEDFDGFERLMDAFTELGNAVISAAFALDATQSAAPAAA